MIVCVKVLFFICTVSVAIALGFQHSDDHAKIEPKFVIDKTHIANGVTTGVWNVWKPWLVKKQDILKNMDKKLNSMLLFIPSSVSKPKPSTSTSTSTVETGVTISGNIPGTAPGHVISSGSNTGIKTPAISVHVGGSNNNAIQHLPNRPAPIIYFYHVTATAKPDESKRDKNQGNKTENHGASQPHSESNPNQNHNHNSNGNGNVAGSGAGAGAGAGIISPNPAGDKEKNPSTLENNSTINVALPAPVPIVPSVMPNYFIPILLTTNLGAHNASIPQSPVVAPLRPTSASNTQTNYGGHTFINVGYPDDLHLNKDKKAFRYKGLTIKGLDKYEGIIVFLPQCIRGDTPSCKGVVSDVKTYTSTDFFGKFKPLVPNDQGVIMIKPDSDSLDNESSTVPSSSNEAGELIESGDPINLSIIGSDTQSNGTSSVFIQGNNTRTNPDILNYILRKDYY